MEKLSLNLGINSYDILFEKDFGKLTEALKEINAPQKLMIVTDSNVARIYGGEVRQLLLDGGYDVKMHIFDAGEENKKMDTILNICSDCIKHNMDRKSMIIALGGGVVGDMAGFAAAIYMRGIRFVQIPTTLLSQSDSSVGGKTGVDFAESKNILGAFHQPKLVYINVSTLKTLPDREFVSGMGEVVKHGIIYDKDFFEYLAENSEKVKSLDADTLVKTAKTNCSVKADVVMKDEKETGLRAVLNFGHTIGHAVESAKHFEMTHGECVGLGMCAAGYIAYKRNMISCEEFEKMKTVIGMYNIPIKTNIDDIGKVIDFMQKDKKKSEGRLKFVLPEKIGSVVIVDDVTENEIYDALNYINERE